MAISYSIQFNMSCHCFILSEYVVFVDDFSLDIS